MRDAEIRIASTELPTWASGVINVVRHKKIEPSIAIEINEARACPPCWIGISRLARDIAKTPFPFVQKKAVFTITRYKKLWQAIIGEISCCNSHRKPCNHKRRIVPL